MKLFSYKGCVNSAAYVAPLMFSWPSPSKIAQVACLSLAGSLLVGCGGSDSSSGVTPDTEAPVVTLSGSDSVELGQGRDYLEYGATVTDNVDEELDFEIEIIADDANSCSDITWNDSEDENYSEDCVGDIFTVSYSATDSAGNISDTVERTITIVEARPFIFTYQTTEANEDFTPNLDPDNYDYNYSIDWGDGSAIEENVTGELTHTYAEAGTYTVTINGDFPTFTTDGDYEENYQSIEQWGDIKWLNVEGFLENAVNVEDNAADTPDLRFVDSLKVFFYRALAFNGDVSLWQVGHITNMERTFHSALVFNQDLSSWDVSSVVNFAETFNNAELFNQDISSWNTSSATDFYRMFNDAEAFNQDISSWDTSAVLYMSYMFDDATVFNQDISSWDTSSVIETHDMFRDAAAFNQDLSSWDMSAVEDMHDMFREAKLSTENYDALLISFAAQDMVTGLEFNGGCSEPSSAADAAVNTLVNNKGWTIEYGTEEECAELFPEE